MQLADELQQKPIAIKHTERLVYLVANLKPDVILHLLVSTTNNKTVSNRWVEDSCIQAKEKFEQVKNR